MIVSVTRNNVHAFPSFPLLFISVCTKNHEKKKKIQSPNITQYIYIDSDISRLLFFPFSSIHPIPSHPRPLHLPSPNSPPTHTPTHTHQHTHTHTNPTPRNLTTQTDRQTSLISGTICIYIYKNPKEAAKKVVYLTTVCIFWQGG